MPNELACPFTHLVAEGIEEPSSAGTYHVYSVERIYTRQLRL